MYKVITPESESDANYAAYEYMLGWFDMQGNWQQKLFTDWENEQSFENEVYNNKRVGLIGAINKDETKSVMLTVYDATLNDLQVYLSMFRAEKVWRIFRDGSTEAVAPDSKTLKYLQKGILYSFTFDIQHVV